MQYSRTTTTSTWRKREPAPGGRRRRRVESFVGRVPRIRDAAPSLEQHSASGTACVRKGLRSRRQQRFPSGFKRLLSNLSGRTYISASRLPEVALINSLRLRAPSCRACSRLADALRPIAPGPTSITLNSARWFRLPGNPT